MLENAKLKDVAPSLQTIFLSLEIDRALSRLALLEKPTQILWPEERLALACERVAKEVEAPLETVQAITTTPGFQDSWRYLLVYRANGNLVCPLCTRPYWKHRKDPQANETLLCNGDLVHLLNGTPTEHPSSRGKGEEAPGRSLGAPQDRGYCKEKGFRWFLLPTG